MTDDQDNPYQTPGVASETPPPSTRLFVWCAGCVFGCAAVGGLIGLAIGGALGVFVPGYYEAVFGGSGTAVNPVAVGIGLGLTQGCVFGGVVGVVLVAINLWYRSRLVAKENDGPRGDAT